MVGGENDKSDDGSGDKAFCVGQDLKTDFADDHVNINNNNQSVLSNFPSSGFGGLSHRVISNNGLKPVIAAVNGMEIGGGMEMVLASDMVVACEKALFGLPEVMRGVVALNGGLTRLVRFIGYQRACEIAFTGRYITAKECKELGIDVVSEALKLASMITNNSPDAIQITKLAILLSLESGSMNEAEQKLYNSSKTKKWISGENFSEGILAFCEKQANMSANDNNSPPTTKYTILQFPKQHPHVLVITIQRPDRLNALHMPAHFELDAIFNWYQSEPELRVAIITGSGDKAFCVGQDLKTDFAGDHVNINDDNQSVLSNFPSSGFGGLSRRVISNNGLKPVIAAVNGMAIGGGMEMVLASDMVVACENALFGLPEVTRGVVALNGGLTRLVRFIGYQRACEIAFTGRYITAKECKELGIDVVSEALKLASMITNNSPDAIQITKLAFLLSLESGSMTEAEQKLYNSSKTKKWISGENFSEGILAFREKPSSLERPKINILNG
ncbi:2325_t:CDS:10 [Entrophospora sp. SA101]|nr:2325_t:CDS:10 [Entrophospora sp. SA101]